MEFGSVPPNESTMNYTINLKMHCKISFKEYIYIYIYTYIFWLILGLHLIIKVLLRRYSTKSGLGLVAPKGGIMLVYQWIFHLCLWQSAGVIYMHLILKERVRWDEPTHVYVYCCLINIIFVGSVMVAYLFCLKYSPLTTLAGAFRIIPAICTLVTGFMRPYTLTQLHPTRCIDRGIYCSFSSARYQF